MSWQVCGIPGNIAGTIIRLPTALTTPATIVSSTEGSSTPKIFSAWSHPIPKSVANWSKAKIIVNLDATCAEISTPNFSHPLTIISSNVVLTCSKNSDINSPGFFIRPTAACAILDWNNGNDESFSIPLASQPESLVISLADLSVSLVAASAVATAVFSRAFAAISKAFSFPISAARSAIIVSARFCIDFASPVAALPGAVVAFVVASAALAAVPSTNPWVCLARNPVTPLIAPMALPATPPWVTAWSVVFAVFFNQLVPGI